MKKRWGVAPIALALAAVFAAAGAAQESKQLRTVHGEVVNKDENPVAAVVYLKNMRTLTVKTYIADEAGRYRFSGLDPNVDYEIHAEDKDFSSAKRTISSYDSRKEIVVHLKVDKKKSGK